MRFFFQDIYRTSNLFHLIIIHDTIYKIKKKKGGMTIGRINLFIFFMVLGYHFCNKSIISGHYKCARPIRLFNPKGKFLLSSKVTLNSISTLITTDSIRQFFLKYGNGRRR